VRLGLGLSFECGGATKLPPPTLTAVSPPIGLAAGGQTINLVGTGLVTGMATVCAGGTCTSVVAAPDGKTATAVTGSMTPSTTAGDVIVTVGGQSSAVTAATKFTPWTEINLTGLRALFYSSAGNTLAGWTVPVATGGGPTVTINAASTAPAAPTQLQIRIEANGNETTALFGAWTSANGGASWTQIATGLTAGPNVAVTGTNCRLVFGAGAYTTAHSYETRSNVSTVANADPANLNSCALSSPTDLNTASWTKTGATASGLTITEDTSTGQHAFFALSDAVPGLNMGRSFAIAGLTVSSTRPWICLQIGGLYAYVRMSDGAKGGGNLTVSASVVAGVATITASGIATGRNFQIGTATADGTISFTGSATQTLTVGNLATCITQTIANYQGTAANRVALIDDASGQPVWKSIATRTLFTLLAGITKPCSFLTCGGWDNDYATEETMIGGAYANTLKFSRTGATQITLNAGTALGFACTTPKLTHCWGGNFDSSTATEAFEDGVSLGTGNAGNASVLGVSIFSEGISGLNPMAGRVYVKAVCNGKVPAVEHAAFYLLCKTRGWVA
jgi:hypothetical protein